jgi:hypothetical protein
MTTTMMRATTTSPGCATDKEVRVGREWEVARLTYDPVRSIADWHATGKTEPPSLKSKDVHCPVRRGLLLISRERS